MGNSPAQLPSQPTLGDRPANLPAPDRPTTLPSGGIGSGIDGNHVAQLPAAVSPIRDIDINIGIANYPPYFGPAWSHISPSYWYYNGPYYAYPYDWYYNRHLTYPAYYMSYAFEPTGMCFTDWYLYEGLYYCYIGDGGTLVIPLPADYYSGVSADYQYYYGPTYAYDDQWYAYRHLSTPARYMTYGSDPFVSCSTYYYLYQAVYYCFTG